MKRLRSEITVASSPLATRWQQSFNREFDTVCQRLPLDLSPTPENSSDSEQTLGELETTLTSQGQSLAVVCIVTLRYFILDNIVASVVHVLILIEV